MDRYIFSVAGVLDRLDLDTGLADWRGVIPLADNRVSYGRPHMDAWISDKNTQQVVIAPCLGVGWQLHPASHSRRLLSRSMAHSVIAAYLRTQRSKLTELTNQAVYWQAILHDRHIQLMNRYQFYCYTQGVPHVIGRINSSP